MEALHPDDAEEVVDEEDDDDGGAEAGVEDHGRPENVAESLLHTEQSQESEM